MGFGSFSSIYSRFYVIYALFLHILEVLYNFCSFALSTPEVFRAFRSITPIHLIFCVPGPYFPFKGLRLEDTVVLLWLISTCRIPCYSFTMPLMNRCAVLKW